MKRSKAAFVLVGIAGALGAIAAACSSFGSAGTVDSEMEASTPADAQVVDRGDAPPPPTCELSVDLKKDPLNCGRCGHSCLGGSCDSGVCQPVVIGKTVGEAVVDVAVDATRVLWLTSNSAWNDAGHVYGCPKSGCPMSGPAIFAGAPSPLQPANLVGNGEDAYFSVGFSGDPHISKLLADGTTARVGTPHPLTVRLQLVAGALYYTSIDEMTNSGGHAETLFRWDGTKETATASVDSASNFLFYEVAGGSAFFADTNGIARCTAGACSGLSPFFASPSGLLSLTTDGTSIFWGSSDGSVSSCLAAGSGLCAPSSVLEPAHLEQAMPLNVLYDHGMLYVATSANAIFACTLPDCAKTITKLVQEPRLFQANEPLFGHALAADDTAFYWAAVDAPPGNPAGDAGEDVTLLTHRIMKLAK